MLENWGNGRRKRCSILSPDLLLIIDAERQHSSLVMEVELLFSTSRRPLTVVCTTGTTVNILMLIC